MKKLLLVLTTLTVLMPSVSSAVILKSLTPTTYNVGATGTPINGDGDATCKPSSSFTVPADVNWTITAVGGAFAISNSAPDTVVAQFYADNGSDSPTGAALETGSEITVTSAYPTAASATSTLAGTLVLQAGTKYWVTWGRTAACVGNTGHFWTTLYSGSAGSIANFDGTSWSTQNNSELSYAIEGTAAAPATASVPQKSSIMWWGEW